MDIRVLVAYASKYGATAGIAEKLGEVIGQAGFQTDVLPVDQARGLAAYQAVVLGSAVYMGRWMKDAVKFLKANEALLTERMVWFFSSGPVEEGDPVELLDGWEFPPLQQEIADRIQPRGITVFHGAIEMENLGPFYKWVIKKVDSPIGDYRDWDAITAWAEEIAAELKQAG